MKAKCPKCGYEWNTMSKMFQVSCPKCLFKVKIHEAKIEDITNGNNIK